MRQAEARAAVEGVPNVQVYSIVGQELLAAGLNAIYTVGRTSLIEPRLVVMELTPTDPTAAAAPPIGLVGKGIVYDTGGLSLKR
jgi:leucyl aminopeptidase|eukprot:COSAG02_NODE_130_length_34758_cov_80.817767_7_plen_84_part_00